MDAVSPLPPIGSASELAIPAIEQPFVGRWNELVSTTNWEKGRIVHEWREALVAAAASSAEFSDEAWSRRVGGVTSQHVGRLRRVYHRFASARNLYPGLHWSHFQAALDWDDAEMWLEGAIQNDWSIESMRRTRGETLAAVQGSTPRDNQNPESEADDDYIPPHTANEPQQSGSSDRADESPIPEGPDFGDEDSPASDSDGTSILSDDQHETIAFVQPFENLAEFPPDFSDAFDAMKLAILRHKNEGWQQVTCDDVLAALDALKQLALAPSRTTPPY